MFLHAHFLSHLPQLLDNSPTSPLSTLSSLHTSPPCLQNCLFLNIYVPQEARPRVERGLVPVRVYIHGGVQNRCSASDPHQNGCYSTAATGSIQVNIQVSMGDRWHSLSVSQQAVLDVYLEVVRVCGLSHVCMYDSVASTLLTTQLKEIPMCTPAVPYRRNGSPGTSCHLGRI